jgi:NADH-quinone oxidoreductase subunit E
VLAGFEDGRADEGPAAAGASLVGLEIAAERGWKAPTAGDTKKASTSSKVEADSKVEAVEKADTSRAETETKIEESPADTAKEGDDD